MKVTRSKSIQSLADELNSRIEHLEKEHGWNRAEGWIQVKNPTGLRMYEFGRFAQLVDLYEDLVS